MERMQKALKQLREIQSKLAEETVSNTSHERLKNIMDSAEKDSFTELFWKEQKKAFGSKAHGMRWHPMMVRFAILIHSQSPSAYRSLREVGVVKLPGESTLRDYTNVLHPQSVFQPEVFLELKKMAEPLSDNERWVCLLHDERRPLRAIQPRYTGGKTDGERGGGLSEDNAWVSPACAL